jgi:hypothetical protein
LTQQRIVNGGKLVLHSLGTKCAFDILYQVKACAALNAFTRGVPMAGFSQNPFCATYFFATAQKSR